MTRRHLLLRRLAIAAWVATGVVIAAGVVWGAVLFARQDASQQAEKEASSKLAFAENSLDDASNELDAASDTTAEAEQAARTASYYAFTPAGKAASDAAQQELADAAYDEATASSAVDVAQDLVDRLDEIESGAIATANQDGDLFERWLTIGLIVSGFFLVGSVILQVLAIRALPRHDQEAAL